MSGYHSPCYSDYHGHRWGESHAAQARREGFQRVGMWPAPWVK